MKGGGGLVIWFLLLIMFFVFIAAIWGFSVLGGGTLAEPVEVLSVFRSVFT
jgi:hypothetical protein